MDTIRLRTLARKSILGFGQYADMTIDNLIKFEKTVYLRWVYYNADMISFLPEILDAIHIPEEYRIDKPGKCPEKHHELNEFIWDKMGGFVKFKKKMHRTRVRMGKFKHNRLKDKWKYSKGNLQAKNQGH